VKKVKKSKKLNKLKNTKIRLRTGFQIIENRQPTTELGFGG
jgi:hypothetical protein